MTRLTLIAADRRERGAPREARHVAAEAIEYADAVLLALAARPCSCTDLGRNPPVEDCPLCGGEEMH